MKDNSASQNKDMSILLFANLVKRLFDLKTKSTVDVYFSYGKIIEYIENEVFKIEYGKSIDYIHHLLIIIEEIEDCIESIVNNIIDQNKEYYMFIGVAEEVQNRKFIEKSLRAELKYYDDKLNLILSQLYALQSSEKSDSTILWNLTVKELACFFRLLVENEKIKIDDINTKQSLYKIISTVSSTKQSKSVSWHSFKNHFEKCEPVTKSALISILHSLIGKADSV